MQSIPITKQLIRGLNRIGCYFFELRTDILYKAIGTPMIVIQILLEVVIAQFIAILILPILIAIHLNGIVSEMNKLIIGVLYLVLITTGTNVTLVTPISLYFAILTKQRCTNLTRSM